MPRHDELVASLRDVILREFDFAADLPELGADTPLFRDGLELDSFGVVELIAQLETTLGFEFREDDFREEHFRTVGTLAALVGRYVAA